MDLERMTTALREILKTHLKANRLWGYHTNNGAIEPTCLGLLALRREEDPEIILAIEMLRDLQNANGSWSPFVGDEPAGCWTTALAMLVMLAVGDRSASLATATRWLVDAKGLRGKLALALAVPNGRQQREIRSSKIWVELGAGDNQLGDSDSF